MFPHTRPAQRQKGTASKLAAVLAVLFVVAVLVPQTGYYGRGARTTFVLFALWSGAAFVAGGLRKTIVFQKTYLMLALAFMGTLVVTHLGRSDLPSQTLAAVIDLVLLLMGYVVAAYHAQNSPARWVRMREWMALLTALAIMPSLQLLYENPRIVRNLIEVSTTIESYSVDTSIARLGIGNYGLYTLLGVVMPCWFAMAVSAGGLRRLLLIAAVGIASVAVALCSLSAATFWLAAGLILFLAGMPLLQEGSNRWLHLLITAGSLGVMLVAGKLLIGGSVATEGSFNKMIRLYEGISGSGLVEGDETERGYMFVRTAQTFLQNPVFGIGYGESRGFVGGHSSCVDPWAYYGLVGYLPFFVFQVLLTRRVVRNWVRQPSNILAFGSMLSWVLVWLAGVLNPTLFFALPALLIFSDCHRDKQPTRIAPVANGPKRGTLECVPARPHRALEATDL